MLLEAIELAIAALNALPDRPDDAMEPRAAVRRASCELTAQFGEDPVEGLFSSGVVGREPERHPARPSLLAAQMAKQSRIAGVRARGAT